jgi:hypothetical protein
MAFSGSTFSRTNGDNTGATLWQDDRDDGDKIVDTRHDTHDQDIADGINACLCKDGQNAMTGDLDMNYSNTCTNVGIATALDEYVTVGQVQDGSLLWGGTATDGGVAGVNYDITVPVAPSAYAAGQMFRFIANNSNGGAATLNVNALGDKNILRQDATSNLEASDIVADGIVDVVYDGTQFLLLNNEAPWGDANFEDDAFTTAKVNVDDIGDDVDFAEDTGVGFVPAVETSKSAGTTGSPTSITYIVSEFTGAVSHAGNGYARLPTADGNEGKLFYVAHHGTGDELRVYPQVGEQISTNSPSAYVEVPVGYTYCFMGLTSSKWGYYKGTYTN